jgi:HEAT repeat protein
MSRDAAALTEIIQNKDAPLFERCKACQRLAVVGTKESVPALAGLLADETLNLYARTALEGIPDPAADEALREAADKLTGRQLVGVLDSIGQRKDAQAVELLKRKLADADATVASAAAGALGRIGDPASAEALKTALAAKADAPGVADACLACAEGLAAAGKKDEAVALYAAVAEADVPKHLKIAALRGQFRLLKGEGQELLLSQLRSEDEDFFNVGLAVARELPGENITAALAKEFESGEAPSARKALLLLALGERAEAAPAELVLKAAKSESPEVREAAVRVLARSNDPSAAAVLLETAVGEGPAAEIARERLKEIESERLNQNLLVRLGQSKGAQRVVLFDIAAARGLRQSVDMAKAALNDSDKSVQAAAVAALGQLIEQKDFPLLTARALKSGDSAEIKQAREALLTAAMRMSDREAAAEALAKNLKGAPVDAQVYLLEVLGRMSGPTALETVVAMSRSDNAALEDAATRVLGDWPNPEASAALLRIAKDADSKHRVRALRGYIRVARQLQLPEEERLEMFNTAIATASRKEEKQLAIDILTRIPSVKTLEMTVSYLGDADLKDAAAAAAVKIATKLLQSEPKSVAGAMQKVVDAGASGDPAVRAQQLLDQAKAAK